MVMITIAGIRNEYWRKKLGCGEIVPPRYARLMVTRGALHHPQGENALRELLTCPPQTHPDINPWGECDLLKTVQGGETFYLKVDCYAATSGSAEEASCDPAVDEMTTRVYTCMLASEY